MSEPLMRWTRFILSLVAAVAWFPVVLQAQEPSRTAWIINPRAADTTNPGLAKIQPEVHSVTVSADRIEVRSAGISLMYFGPFQTGNGNTPRHFRFLFPRTPRPERGRHTGVRPDFVGAFVTGVPIPALIDGASWQGQNLWHYDPIAAVDDGGRVAGGRSNAEHHPMPLGMLERMIAEAGRHSPLIGYAFDGYPIYGPWGFAEGNGGVRRMRSGYRVRRIATRDMLPDGTVLMPGQEGPAVDAANPLGTFVEDYEFVSGAGDLDEFNGRFTRTPEYPSGTYAYFLTTDDAGRIAYPYFLAAKYFGRISPEELANSVRINDSAPELGGRMTGERRHPAPRVGEPVLSLRTSRPVAGKPVRLSFRLCDKQGNTIRSLEYVHERPLHLMVVSDDLTEFDHVHPELVGGDRYELSHVFPSGGRFRLYCDYTPPGGARRVEFFDVAVAGSRRIPHPLKPDAVREKTVAGVTVRMTAKEPLRAGTDLDLAFEALDAGTGKPVAGLEPFLGAWAHFVVIDRGMRNFIHAHPLENTAVSPTAGHVHTPQSLGPPPETIRTTTSFPTAGRYRLWAQFQVDGTVVTVPFTVDVGPAPVRHSPTATVAGDVKITVGPEGFVPARVPIPSDRPVRLAVTRDTRPNCGNRIVVPSLGISRDIAPGETVTIDLPAMKAGKVAFTCGMGMYQGAFVVRE